MISRLRGLRKGHAPLGNDAAGPGAHAEDAVGQEGGLAQVVGDEQDGDGPRRMQVAHHAPQLFAGEAVERGERLVQHQQARLVDQGAAQRGALLHAARQLPGILGAEPGEADLGQQRLDLGDIGFALRTQAPPVGLHDLQRQKDVLERLAPRQQVRSLERHAGDLERAGDLLAADRDGAALGELQAGHEFHQGGLAAAGRADHGGELTLADGETELVDGDNAAIAAIGVGDVVDVDELGHDVISDHCPR